MGQAFVLLLVGLTSAGACWVGTRGLRLSPTGLRLALGRMLESVGMTVIFFVVNLAVGVTGILVARMVMGVFVSLYLAADETILVLSLLQGLTFQWWWNPSAPYPRNLSRR